MLLQTPTNPLAPASQMLELQLEVAVPASLFFMLVLVKYTQRDSLYERKNP